MVVDFPTASETRCMCIEFYRIVTKRRLLANLTSTNTPLSGISPHHAENPFERQ
jgi:hypothetical protein